MRARVPTPEQQMRLFIRTQVEQSIKLSQLFMIQALNDVLGIGPERMSRVVKHWEKLIEEFGPSAKDDLSLAIETLEKELKRRKLITAEMFE